MYLGDGVYAEYNEWFREITLWTLRWDKDQEIKHFLIFSPHEIRGLLTFIKNTMGDLK